MGLPCALGEVLDLAAEFNLPVIEDAACAIGSEINIDGTWEKIGRPHGDIACFSFHPRKIVATGDGGMLTTRNAEYDNKFRLYRQHGMSVPDTVRHNAKKVVFEDYVTTGFNYRMTDVQAAIGIEQLKRLPDFLNERRKLATLYHEKLKNISWLMPLLEPSYCRTNWQSYPVRVADDSPVSRDALMQSLLDHGISTRRGIMNAHQEPPYTSIMQLHNSERSRDSVILLPLFNGMTEEQINEVVKGITHV